MIEKGATVTLDVEKPAAGGRMIARHDGQVVLVWGAIPGERTVIPTPGASARDELRASTSEHLIGVRVACEKLRVPTTRQEGSKA